MKPPRYAAGIDMAAATFTVSISPTPGEVLYGPREFSNNPDGFKALIGWFQRLQIRPQEMMVCMEATGVYGELLSYFLHEHRYSLAVEAPLKVKRAFKVDGHKTDPVDSKQIAEYALRFFNRLSLWQPRETIAEKMKSLITARELLVRHKTATLNNLNALKRKAVQSPKALKVLEKTVKALTRDIQALEDEMDKLIDGNPHLNQTVSRLISAPGAGTLLAMNLLVVSNGFTSQKTYRQYASYLKIAPLQHESGSSIKKRPRTPHYGPATLRKLLHLAARSVVTHNQEFRHYYLRKQAEGKPKKLILNNVENKLLKILCAMIRDQRPYIPGYRSIRPEVLKFA